MACAVAALTVELLLGHPVTPAVLALTVPALALDAVDGRVARRTGTVTAFGGRFDGEVDAFLILVLSVAAAPTVGWWVLAAGLVRYAFAVAGWCLPWMRAPLEFRYWRKVVTAVVGIALTVAVADVLPHALTTALVVVALGLLAESFGRDVGWLWRHRERARAAGQAQQPAEKRSARGRNRRHRGPGGGSSPGAPPPWPWRWCGSRWWRPPDPTGSLPAPCSGSRWRRSSWPRSCSWCRPGRPGP